MNLDPDHRVTREHRSRDAVVYVRQSDPQQVRTNTESTRIQLGLRERAIGLGWPCPVVIDDDLGVSAGGYAEREGFRKLLALVATRQVGIILSMDASRLSRNSKDWAHLFELCGYFHTLVADLEQVYDLSRPNDRLVIGIKGTVSEMELNILRTRLRTGQEAKAARGELRYNLPTGYVHDSEGRIVFDPDQRVRCAIARMFEQFDRCTSVRQLTLWYHDTNTLFPVRRRNRTSWEIPTARTLQKLLVHPLYAGAYVYGRRATRVEYVDGRLVKRTTGYLPKEEWQVCLHDHHDAYISWDRLLANEAKIADNRVRCNMNANRGPIREGPALLTGLLRCGRCGAKFFVGYKARSALYYCDGGAAKGSRRCCSFGSFAIDGRVGEELCRVVQPLSIDAAIEAEKQRDRERDRELEAARQQVQAAQYEADRAFEQFDQVDPKNRLVADTLEGRLNERLADLHRAKRELDEITTDSRALTKEERQRLRDLAGDFQALWDHPKADPILKKRLVRSAIEEIVVTHQPEDHRLEVIIHWKGGAHTKTHVRKHTRPSPTEKKSLEENVRLLATEIDDAGIARILNMNGFETPGGLRWTSDRVQSFRRQHHIRGGKRNVQEGFLTQVEAAAYLGISRNGVIGLRRIGAITPNQIAHFAPWKVAREELDSERVQRLVRYLKRNGRLPRGGCSEDQTGLFD